MCLCMNRPYQSYYFVPLVTFWYTVVYVTLVLPPRVTAAGSAAKPITHLYLVGKIVALLACITVLYSSQVIFEALFETRPWKGLFVTSDGQAREWFFRWALDRYRLVMGFDVLWRGSLASFWDIFLFNLLVSGTTYHCSSDKPHVGTSFKICTKTSLFPYFWSTERSTNIVYFFKSIKRRLEKWRHDFELEPLFIEVDVLTISIDSICFGMIFAYLYVCAIKYNLIDDSTAGNLWRCAATNSVATAMALVAVVGYSVFTFTCTSKPQCNAVHSYIAFLPVNHPSTVYNLQIFYTRVFQGFPSLFSEAHALFQS